jgi:hypothetical protein
MRRWVYWVVFYAFYGEGNGLCEIAEVGKLTSREKKWEMRWAEEDNGAIIHERLGIAC